MSGSAILVKGIKTRLKAQGISYRRLAELIGISEPTVKRDLARGNFSLQRLDLICDALGVSVADLVQPVDHAPLTELSERQEQALVTNPRALVVTYLIVNDWKLDELRIVDFQPPKRMRKLTARNFSWRKDGAVQEYFLRRVIPEFFNARFDSPGDEFRFVGGLLSSSSMLRLQASIRRFADEYEQLAHQDARLPLEERHGWSAILALRLWEYSEFSKLRRDRPGAGR